MRFLYKRSKMIGEAWSDMEQQRFTTSEQLIAYAEKYLRVECGYEWRSIVHLQDEAVKGVRACNGADYATIAEFVKKIVQDYIDFEGDGWYDVSGNRVCGALGVGMEVIIKDADSKPSIRLLLKEPL